MILNYAQINSALSALNKVKNEQLAITSDAENVIVSKLSQAWQCQAQAAFEDAFIVVRDRILKQINSLIELFETAAKQSKEGFYKIDVDLSTMNITAITGE